MSSETLSAGEMRASAATERGEWEEAARLWAEVLTSSPSANAKYCRAEALMRLDRMQDAQAALKLAVAQHPRSRRINRLGAELAARMDQWDEAADRWGQVLQLPGKAPSRRLLREIVLVHCRAGRFEDAHRILQSTDSIDRDSLEANNLASEIEFHRWRAARGDVESSPPGSGRPITVQDICQTFWDIEQHFGTLDWRIHEIAVWPLVRMPLFYKITQRVGLYDAPHPNFKSRRDFESSAGAGLSSAAQGRDSVILMTTRKLNGSEPYSNAVRAALGDRALLLDRPTEGALLPGAVNFDNVIDDFRSRFKRSDVPHISVQDHIQFFEIQEAFRRELGVEVSDLPLITQRRLSDFVAARDGFLDHFSRHPIKQLFLTNAYGATTQAAVAAARQSGARTVELQHGLITPYHLGYSWPGRPNVPNAADELWSFGSFWGETVELPGRMSVRVIGAPYIQEAAQGAEARIPNLVVFTSQGVIGRRLFPIALEAARRRPDKKVVFRLHPSEILSDFEGMVPADPPANFSLSAREPNIFALLASADIQVGAFSTTLFEGMSLGTRTVVLDLPGVEYMAPVIRRGDALFVRDVDDLVARLDMAPTAADPSAYYAPPAKSLALD